MTTISGGIESVGNDIESAGDGVKGVSDGVESVRDGSRFARRSSGSNNSGEHLHSWITTLSPSTQLSKDPVESILGWPRTKTMPPVLIHLHSVVVHSIYRIFCKIGDKEIMKEDELLWMIVLSFQRRAKTELVRANTKDIEAARNPRNTGNQSAPGPEDQFDHFKEVWHTPPHIVVTKEAVTFGDMWPRPRGHEMASPEPAPVPGSV
ncbi:hypothetical protein BGZ81_011301 [Podila clonocystis]|nr:hypothetical protein BGZ81_011301 [Podila clonocystis]